MLLRQGKDSPMALHTQVITLICADSEYFTDIPVRDIPAARESLNDYFEREQPAICLRIDHQRRFSEGLKDQILAAAEVFRGRNGGAGWQPKKR